FWLFACIIGWIIGQSLLGMLVWVGIIFVSVLFHEFGHALTAVIFKQKTRIQLVALGGLTTFEGPKLKFWQQFIITFNGPLFGFFLFLIATALLQFTWPVMMTKILKMAQYANLFWTIVNLLPVLPLDGGQLLRIILEASFGIQGFKASLLIGAILSALFALYFFLIRAYLAGAFFFLFAFQSFESWRRSRFANASDRDEENRQMMMRAEEALNAGNTTEAKRLLDEVRQKANGGMLAHAAQQYLAYLDYKEGHKKEAYELLLPIKEHLADDALCMLHELAAMEKNDSLVIELSAKCYQIDPSQKRAIDNARAFAREGKAKHAGGWLQTAWHYGSFALSQLLQEEAFKKVSNDPEFQRFLEDLK
ncbi:MAG: site-2 protease family protein, partial [Verrucomicrobia bacterium]|nr:site-2 protease family protein [Verrucomicrobiota bacterium]